MSAVAETSARSEASIARRERVRVLLRSPSFIIGAGVILFWLACAILEQPGSHSATSEATAEPRPLTAHDQRDAVVVELELDLVARMHMRTVAQRLRDHDLSLRSDPAGHTRRV